MAEFTWMLPMQSCNNATGDREIKRRKEKNIEARKQKVKLPTHPHPNQRDRCISSLDTFGLFLIQFRLDLQSVKSEKHAKRVYAEIRWRRRGEGDEKYNSSTAHPHVTMAENSSPTFCCNTPSVIHIV